MGRRKYVYAVYIVLLLLLILGFFLDHTNGKNNNHHRKRKKKRQKKKSNNNNNDNNINRKKKKYKKKKMHKQNVILNDDEQLKPDEDISNSVTEEGKINNVLDNVNNYNNNNNDMMGWDEHNKKKMEREISHQDLLHSSNNICLENKKHDCIFQIPIITPHVIFVSIGIRGHAIPLLRIAKEFISQNPNVKVSFATHHRAREWVKSTGANFLSLGRFPISPSELRATLKKISADPSMFRGLLTLFNDVYLPLFQPMYNEVLNIIAREAPTLVVVDIASLGAIDAVQKYKIPLVLNSPTFPFSLDVSSHPWLPNWGTGFSIQMSLWDRCMNILFPRLLAVALTPAFIHINKLRYGNTMERYKSQHDVFYGIKILVNTAIGFDHPKPLPPWIEMVGSILPTDENENATPLSNSLMEWLELQDVPTSGMVASSGTGTATATNNKNKRNSGAEVRNKQKRRGKNNKNHVDEEESMTNEEFSDDDGDHFNRYQNNDLSDVTSTSSIVYVNFGWMSRIEKKHIDALLNGLTDPRLRIIWTMSNDQRSLLPKNIPPSFKILNKLGQSTMHLLRRQEVKIVVSHCGMGVAQEALMFGKPLLCLPLFGDQIDVAARVLDRGVGRVLDKVRITSSDVRRAILEIVRSYDLISKRARKIAASLKLAGGINRAVNVLRHYHEEHLIVDTFTKQIENGEETISIISNRTYLRLVSDTPSQISWFERYYLDVYLVFIAILCILTIFVHMTFRFTFYVSVQFLHYMFKHNSNNNNYNNDDKISKDDVSQSNNNDDDDTMRNDNNDNINKTNDETSGVDGPD